MKVILITGSSRGIGKEVAKYLAKKDYQVIVNYNKSENQAIKLKEELKKENINIDIFKANVSIRQEVKALVDFIINKYKRIDILVNNAGISSTNLFTDISDEEWDRVIKINLYSAFCVTQEIVPYMIHQKKGCIINISSIWGQVGASVESLYSISKAGIDAMTKSLAKELGPSNIRVNSIAPGFINTDMNKNLSEKEIETIKKETPLEKLGKAIDIAKCINWLIEDDFTTGQVISINGGWVIT